MMRELLGDNPANAEVKALATKLSGFAPKTKPEWGRNWAASGKDAIERAKFDPYGLYFCNEAMFFSGGSDWTEWNKTTSASIMEMQDLDGAWRTNDIYSMQGGTCYSTALCILALQVHHRIIHSVPTKGGVDE